MAYNYNKLLGRIIEKYGSQAKFAAAMGMSERSLSLKLNNLRPFKQEQITKACLLLDIPECDIPLYFFTLQVQLA